ncbi:hypothetical protein TrRE_jg674 [Triparma retinervis]|uniref:Uncharacterized protein n=1 Tax=Triparma retinervis TaxID=2557542 RepID=A0A9W7G4T2_9STRA|nr:hypothetical protein TrRE_jg674 [Triparma retinervis]
MRSSSVSPSVYEADRADWVFPTELDLPPQMVSSFRRLNDCMRVLFELRGPTVVNWGFGFWTIGGFFWCYPLFKDELKIFKNWVETGEIEDKVRSDSEDRTKSMGAASGGRLPNTTADPSERHR